MERSAAEDLWRHRLAQIPTTFGRLVYLSSLYDSETCLYHPFGLARHFGDSEADAALRKSHVDWFYAWLHFTLEQKKADLDLYLTDVEGQRTAILRTWLQFKPYRNLVPAGILEVEHDLYATDLDAVLAVLTRVHDVSAPDPATPAP